MQQVLAYYKASTAGATLADIPAVTDPNFSIRNNHWIFTEDYLIQAIGVFGASITAAQLYDATYNAINTPQLYPPNLTVYANTNPQLIDLRKMPPQIPLNEEIAVQMSNGAAMGTDDEFALLFITPKGSNLSIPMSPSQLGQYGRVRALFTATATLTKGSWTTDATITITNLIKGGTYCLLDAYIVNTSALAFRMNLVRAPLYNGRKLLPGGLCEHAYGNIPLALGSAWCGPMGYFDTFELPLISFLASATAMSATYTGYLDLLWMGPNMLSNQPLTA